MVSPDSKQFRELLESEFPDATLRVRPLAKSVYITGYVPRPEMVHEITTLARDYYRDVINGITVGGVHQVALHVKVMEVSRTKLRQLGLDWEFASKDFTIYQGAGSILAQSRDPSGDFLVPGIGGDTVRLLVGDTTKFIGYLQALRQQNLVKLLAEPTLLTISGRPARFESGGEIPVPEGQGLGTFSDRVQERGDHRRFRADCHGQRHYPLGGPSRGHRTQSRPGNRGQWRADPGFDESQRGHGGRVASWPNIGPGRPDSNPSRIDEQGRPASGRLAFCRQGLLPRGRKVERGGVADRGHAGTRRTTESARGATVRSRSVDGQPQRQRAVFLRLSRSPQLRRGGARCGSLHGPMPQGVDAVQPPAGATMYGPGTGPEVGPSRRIESVPAPQPSLPSSPNNAGVPASPSTEPRPGAPSASNARETSQPPLYGPIGYEPLQVGLFAKPRSVT